ncbi:MAG: hypothetical protein N3F08_05555 [Crenarchaeota archaeon]|nr:hypothetical protein [Thermoproteota archaeon]
MRLRGNHMISEQGFTRLLTLAIILIVFVAATVFTLRTIEVAKHRQLALPYQDGLTGWVFCPKCFSSTGLEPTENHAFRCRNCGFFFSFGSP